MINDYLKEIINLDKQVDQDIANIDAEVKKIKETTLEQIQEKELHELTELREKCQSDYDLLVNEAEEKKDKAIAKAQKESDILFEGYEKIKGQIADQAIESLFLIDEF